VRRLKPFLQDASGASAVEFAIIVPVLAAVVAGGFDLWQMINRKQDMHAAVAAGVHYYMAGGADDPTGQSISLSSWSHKPSDGTVSIARACICGGVAASCTVVCAATQQAPEVRVTVSANSQWTGMRPATLTESEVVRVR
jgi:Flp pilus assembly protein TadG